MPISAPADPYRVPDEPTDPFYWDGSNPKGGGGSSQPFNPGFGPSAFGASGGAFPSNNYQPFTGYGDPRRRKNAMGAAPGAFGMMPTGRGFSAGRGMPQGGGGRTGLPGEVMDYGDDYFGGILRNRFGGEDTGYSHAGGGDMEALLDWVISGKGQGMFGPEGDSRVNAIYDQDATRKGMALENSAVLGAQFDGGSPWEAGLARTLARSNASRGKWDFYNQNKLNNAQRYSDLFDFAVKHKTGEYDAQKEREAMLADKDHDESRANKAAIWGGIGNLAGAGIGAISGNPFGGGGGGSGSTFPRYNYLGGGRQF